MKKNIVLLSIFLISISAFSHTPSEFSETEIQLYNTSTEELETLREEWKNSLDTDDKILIEELNQFSREILIETIKNKINNSAEDNPYKNFELTQVIHSTTPLPLEYTLYILKKGFIDSISGGGHEAIAGAAAGLAHAVHVTFSTVRDQGKDRRIAAKAATKALFSKVKNTIKHIKPTHIVKGAKVGFYIGILIGIVDGTYEVFNSETFERLISLHSTVIRLKSKKDPLTQLYIQCSFGWEYNEGLIQLRKTLLSSNEKDCSVRKVRKRYTSTLKKLNFDLERKVLGLP